MQEFFNAIKDFFNTDLGVALISITTSFIYLLVIFSKTSLGKKLFNRMSNEVKQITEIARLSNEKVNEYKTYADNQINLLQSEYERKIAILISYEQAFQEGLSKIIEKIPNKKVQDEYDLFLKDYEQKKIEILKNFPTFDDFLVLKELAGDVQEKVNEQVEIIKNEYQQLFEMFKQEVENRLNEKESNTNAEEKEI